MEPPPQPAQPFFIAAILFVLLVAWDITKSIAGNLLTPPAERVIRAIREKRAKQNIESARKELERIREHKAFAINMASNPAEHILFILSRFTRFITTVSMAFIGVAAVWLLGEGKFPFLIDFIWADIFVFIRIPAGLLILVALTLYVVRFRYLTSLDFDVHQTLDVEGYVEEMVLAEFPELKTEHAQASKTTEENIDDTGWRGDAVEEQKSKK